MPTLTFGFTAQQIVDEGRITWEDINFLKTWLKTQNFPKLTDEQIVLFLLSCLNEHEPTKSTIKAHYSIKNRYPALFNDRDTKLADVQKQLNTVEICCMPERTDDGYVVAVMRFHDTYYGNYEQAVAVKILFMTLDATLYEHPPKGLIMLVDMKGTSIMHLTKFRLGNVKAFFEYLQEGVQMRLKEIHVMNTVYFIDKFMFITKPFMKREVYNMIHFHNSNMNMELFYEKSIPKKCLPEDYGGDLPSVRVLHQNNIENLANLESHFQEEELQRHSVNYN